jgi:cold shock CspA family protein
MQREEVCGSDEVHCTRDASAAEIAKRMRNHHVVDLVVVEPHAGRLVRVGVVTEHDLVEKVLAEGVRPETITAGDLMSREPVTAFDSEAAPGAKGRVAWMTDGYGFIEVANGDQYYFDRNSVDDPHYEELHVGMRVEFQVHCAGGRRQALRVTAACNPPA